MNIYEQLNTHAECRRNRTCKRFNPEYWYQALASPGIHLSSKTDHVGVTTMERLDQGDSIVNWRSREASTQAKGFSNSVLIAIPEHLLYILARDTAPSSACAYMNIHEHTWAALGCRLNSTEYWYQTLASPHIHCQARQITSGSPLWRDMTKVILHLNWRFETDMSRPGIKPGPPKWEASALAKSYLNSALIAIWNIYIWASDMAPPPPSCGYMNIHEHT